MESAYSRKKLSPNMYTADLSNHLKIMGNERYKIENCQSTMDQAFLIAESKITGNENKQTIQGLREMVRKLEEELY